MIRPHGRRSGDHQDIPARPKGRTHCPKHLPEPPPDAIPDDGRADRPAGRQSEPRRPEVRLQDPCRQERVGPHRPVLHERREIRRTGEHHEAGRRPAALDDQADRRLRPRARRAARTRRPPAVFMRARKPCSLARWRFLGWKVCFIVPARDPLHRASGFCPLRPLKARKRAGARHGRGAFIVRRMIGPPRKGCQTPRRRRAGAPTGGAQVARRWRASPRAREDDARIGPFRRPGTYTPWEYRGIALRVPSGGAIFRHPTALRGSPRRRSWPVETARSRPPGRPDNGLWSSPFLATASPDIAPAPPPTRPIHVSPDQ